MALHLYIVTKNLQSSNIADIKVPQDNHIIKKGGLVNENLSHIRKLYTLLACQCNGHGDCAYWQDCGLNFISLDVLCWIHAGEQEIGK